MDTSTDRVWCVLVMLNEAYACGAAVVAQSLRNVGSKYPAWCMVSDGVSQDCADFLGRHFDRVIRVPLISYNCIPMRSQRQRDIYGGWIHASFTKWNFINSDIFPAKKAILVDADMIFLQNCDNLFNLPSPALTFSSAWARPYNSGPRMGAPNPYGVLAHGAKVEHKHIRSAFSNSFLGLGCMVLIEPSRALFDLMMVILRRTPVYGHSGCISGFDEQLITETLLSTGRPIYHIHQQYNWVVGKHNWLLNGEKPFTQQYYNEKPWNDDRATTQWDDVRDWYKVWDGVIADDQRAADWLPRPAEKIN